jgi:hypothetical protein
MAKGYQVGRGFSIPLMNANPTVGLQLIGATGGTLAIGTAISIRYSFVTADGKETGTTNAQSLTPSGSNNAITVNLGSQYYPAWAVGANIYASTTAGAESYQGQITTPGGSYTISTLKTDGKPFPQWNMTSYMDVNLTALGLPGGSEFIVRNIYYNNPVAFGIWDSVNSIQTMFDGDIGNGARMGIDVHCNANQWLRIFNGSAAGSLQVAIDGIQTQ